MLSKKYGGLDQNCLFITTGKPHSEARIQEVIKKRYMSSIQLIPPKIHFKHLNMDEFKLFMTNIDDYITQNRIKMIVIDSFISLTLEFIDENSNDLDYLSRSQFLRE